MPDIDRQKQIVSSAVKYFLEMMGTTETPIEDPRLEEIEKKDDDTWDVTISYVEKIDTGSFAALYGKKDRIYKVINIDGETKAPISMKSRQ